MDDYPSAPSTTNIQPLEDSDTLDLNRGHSFYSEYLRSERNNQSSHNSAPQEETYSDYRQDFGVGFIDDGGW
ncbi:MAG: hypothetical protein HRU09_09310 [Oligoflexales bacterium]|nr:hypothetical protein [Oligoflexales bacterium]